MVLKRLVDRLTFPSRGSSYSLASQKEMFFIQKPGRTGSGDPGIPCMMYSRPRGALALIVYAHTNGNDIGDMHRPLRLLAQALNVHVLSFEYPGYGLHLGKPSMQTIDATVEIVTTFIVSELNVNLSQVIWYGCSIGSGPACRAAHRASLQRDSAPAGLIVQCGFSNFKRVAGHLFGKVAKHLVPRSWPNIELIADLSCPVLLIHGVADKVIPISHSEDMWNVVKNKRLSRFHACQCGHNNFDFERSVLRPIAEFMQLIVAEPSYPKTQFFINKEKLQVALVRHIIPLKTRIQLGIREKHAMEAWLKQDADEEKSGVGLAIENEAFIGSPNVSRSPSHTTRSAKKESQIDSYEFCKLPALVDPEQAILTTSGMLRSCARRMDIFLAHLQHRLSSVSALAQKSLREVVEFVEAEFWFNDPLFSLYEEVDFVCGPASSGELRPRVRFRAGPFWAACDGTATCENEVTPHLSQSLDLRVPLWICDPAWINFGLIAEYLLTQSNDVSCNLQGGKPSPGRKCTGFMRRPTPPKTHSLSRQDVAAIVAEAFVVSLHKHSRLVSSFQHFVKLYCRGSKSFSRQTVVGVAKESANNQSAAFPGTAAATATSAGTCAGNESSEVAVDDACTTATATEEVLSARQSASHVSPEAFHAPSAQLLSSRAVFHSAVRRILDVVPAETGNRLTAIFDDLIGNMAGTCGDAQGVVAESSRDFKAYEQRCFPDLSSAGGISIESVGDGGCDWFAANALEQYKRFPSGDPLRADARTVTVALNAAMRSWKSFEQRERLQAEVLRAKLTNPSSRVGSTRKNLFDAASASSVEGESPARVSSLGEATKSASGRTDGGQEEGRE
eukprot:TRINITY_DN54970_c0_g1_i1.p1 TRINITY_DN54970_c0_g1~~TRINITY_DN54970_c0_g1_i1.p1  ORF type:complete len:844 (-),score=93.94 TRINITY_DN54970_c0_g1_i1:176-2707(-)